MSKKEVRSSSCEGLLPLHVLRQRDSHSSSNKSSSLGASIRLTSFKAEDHEFQGKSRWHFAAGDTPLLYMFVESMEVFKTYSKSSRQLNIGFRIVDYFDSAIERAVVTIKLNLPEGKIVYLTEATDREGIAFFRIGSPENGRWDVSLSSVNHPIFSLDFHHVLTLCHTTNI